MKCRMLAVAGSVLTFTPSLIGAPLAAQQVIQLPAADRLLDADRRAA